MTFNPSYQREIAEHLLKHYNGRYISFVTGLKSMTLTPEEQALRKRIYPRLDGRKPLRPDDPNDRAMYHPIYSAPGCEDPVQLLQDHIELSDVESLQMFSGFRGSGKTTELFRLQKNLQQKGYVVLYADALNYISPSEEIDITDLLIVLAGAFSDALEQWAKEIDQTVELTNETFWTRIKNYLMRTTASLTEVSTNLEMNSPAKEVLGGLKAGVNLKLAIKESPSFRKKVQEFMQNRIPELRSEVHGFFQDGVMAIKQAWQGEKQIVFIFDSLEQLRGSLSNEQAVLRSVERVFANHIDNLLRLPYVHVVYTVPPWLQFVMPGAADIYMLPSIRQWDNDDIRSRYEPGWEALREVVMKRIGKDGCTQLFNCEAKPPFTGADDLIALCGGHLRDLLLLLRETVLRIRSMPVTDEVLKDAIASVRNNFFPISIDDAIWLKKIGESRTSELPNTATENVSRLTRFLDTHFVLYLTNGKDWYDIHPLIREEVTDIVNRHQATTPVKNLAP
jgi:hypothetical protein